MYNALLGRAGMAEMIGHATKEKQTRRGQKPDTGQADLEDRYGRVLEALRDLYELLEEYAPPWYTEQHHDKASAALDVKPRRHPRK